MLRRGQTHDIWRDEALIKTVRCVELGVNGVLSMMSLTVCRLWHVTGDKWHWCHHVATEKMALVRVTNLNRIMLLQ